MRVVDVAARAEHTDAEPTELVLARGRVPVERSEDGNAGRSQDVVALMDVDRHVRDPHDHTEVVRDQREIRDRAGPKDALLIQPALQARVAMVQGVQASARARVDRAQLGTCDHQEAVGDGHRRPTALVGAGAGDEPRAGRTLHPRDAVPQVRLEVCLLPTHRLGKLDGLTSLEECVTNARDPERRRTDHPHEHHEQQCTSGEPVPRHRMGSPRARPSRLRGLGSPSAPRLRR